MANPRNAPLPTPALWSLLTKRYAPAYGDPTQKLGHLDPTFQGHSRSSKPRMHFDRVPMTFCYWSIVIAGISLAAVGCTLQMNFGSSILINEKKRSERRKHCALAVVRRSQKFSARRRPRFPGVQDGQNLISWRWSLPLPKNPVWWGSTHAISSYRGNRPTHKHTNKSTNTDRTDYAQCNKFTKTLPLYSVVTSRRRHWRVKLALLFVEINENY